MTTTLGYLEALRQVPAPAAPVVVRLRRVADRLAREATTVAVGRLQPLLEQGRFRRAAAPVVTTHLPAEGPIALRVAWDRIDADRWPPRIPFAGRPTSPWWRTGEEETGWPSAVIDLLVTPADGGAQLTAIVDRAPGYDTSTNRVDKQLRDRVAREAIAAFVDALAGLLSSELSGAP